MVFKMVESMSLSLCWFKWWFILKSYCFLSTCSQKCVYVCVCVCASFFGSLIARKSLLHNDAFYRLKNESHSRHEINAEFWLIRWSMHSKNALFSRIPIEFMIGERLEWIHDVYYQERGRKKRFLENVSWIGIYDSIYRVICLFEMS